MAYIIVIYCSRATQGLFVLCIVLINIKVKSIWCPSFKRLHPVTICTSILQLSSWPKESSFVRCIKKQLITLQNFNIQTCYSQFLWFFILKGSDHLAHSWGGLGCFLGSQWDRQLKFSAYASFLISWSLSKFELI